MMLCEMLSKFLQRVLLLLCKLCISVSLFGVTASLNHNYRTHILFIIHSSYNFHM